jgi:hypothetical protein
MIGCRVGVLISLSATGKVTHVPFREQEDVQGYFLLITAPDCEQSWLTYGFIP